MHDVHAPEYACAQRQDDCGRHVLEAVSRESEMSMATFRKTPKHATARATIIHDALIKCPHI
jgi:hypothetical protein